jgi:3-oxoacyl-[acyl-carrier-protein] synthase II
MRRVCITGIGLITGLGIDTAETWQGLVEGRSAVGILDRFNTTSLKAHLGAQIPDADPLPYLDPSQRRMARAMTVSDCVALVSAALAIRDSGLKIAEEDRPHVGLFIGGNKEGSEREHFGQAVLAAQAGDGTVDMARLGEVSKSTYPLAYVEDFASTSLYYVSRPFNLQGVNDYFAGAEEAGAYAVGAGFRAIRRGDASVTVVGSVAEPLSWWQISRWESFGALTTRNDLGSGACRPYDRSRTGTVLGEGAAFLVLEEYDRAKRRGAHMYAEITGFGRAFDAHRLITPDPCGRAVSRSIASALREAGISSGEVGYIATHGAATELGDVTDARGIRGALGAAADRVVASSIKPATGHLLMGAGALQVAVAALVLEHQIAPPTLNLDTPDPACDLDWVPGEARDVHIDNALALARGFEGQSAALALSAVN